MLNARPRPFAPAADRRRPLRRTAAAVATMGLAVAGLLLGAASPAHAAPFPVTDAATFTAAIAAANLTPEADTIAVDANITDVDLNLEVTSPLTITVNGHTVSSVRLQASAPLTMAGPGNWTAGLAGGAEQPAAAGIGILAPHVLEVRNLTLTASGGTCDAGIGAWNTNPFTGGCASSYTVEAGPIRILNSTVTATGGLAGSAIGGAFAGHGADIEITDSAVTATSGSGAAAIGAERPTSDLPIAIAITDSTVTATAQGAGIGAGQSNSGAAAITVTGSTITATGDYGIGAWRGTTTLALAASTLTDTVVNSTTSIPAGSTVTVDGVTFWGPVTNDGTIVATGALAGTGAITNNGLIRPASMVTASNITVNDYTVTLDENYPGAPTATSVRVYAPTLASVGETLGTPPARPGWVFLGWNTSPGGDGLPVTDTTALNTLTLTDQVTAYAVWTEQVVTLTPASGQVPAGTSAPFTSTAYAAGGIATDVSGTAVLTSSNPDDVITGTSILFTTLGTRTITSTFDGVTGTASVEVLPGDPVGIDVAASAATVDQGGSVTLIVTGWDAYGHPVPIDPAAVVVTSSVPTDVIDGLTVTFPHASPHLLTATVGELTSEVTVDVTPAPAPAPASTPAALAALPATGGTDAVAPALLAVGLLLAGVTTLLFTRRRRTD